MCIKQKSRKRSDWNSFLPLSELELILNYLQDFKFIYFNNLFK